MKTEERINAMMKKGETKVFAKSTRKNAATGFITCHGEDNFFVKYGRGVLDSWTYDTYEEARRTLATYGFNVEKN